MHPSLVPIIDHRSFAHLFLTSGRCGSKIKFSKIFNHDDDLKSNDKRQLYPKIQLCEDGPMTLIVKDCGFTESATSSSWESSISEDCRLRLVPWAAPWFFLRIELRDSSVILWIWAVWGGPGRQLQMNKRGATCHITQPYARLTKNWCLDWTM